MKAILVSNSALKPTITGEGESQITTYLNDTLAALDAQRQAGAFVGVSHDNENHYFCQTNADWQSVDHIELKFVTDENGSNNLAQLEFIIGKVLASDSHALIVADHAVFKMLFERPLWQLWCCNQETSEQLNSAYKLVFGELATLNTTQTLQEQKHQVRSQIKSMLLSA